MNIIDAQIPDLKIIEPDVFKDARGYFCETYNRERYFKSGICAEFVQDNESCSTKGVIRGLHWQAAPHTQAKLVRVIRGAVWDVAVDIRRDSPTYGKHVAVVLSEENRRQFFIPRGFAHGFVVLEDNTLFSYKCDIVSADISMKILRGMLRHGLLFSVLIIALAYAVGHLMNSVSSWLLEKHIYVKSYEEARQWFRRVKAKSLKRAQEIQNRITHEFNLDVEQLTSFDLRIRMEENFPRATVTGFSFLSFYGMSRTLALIVVLAIPPVLAMEMRFSAICGYHCCLSVVLTLVLMTLCFKCFVHQYLRFVEYYYDFLGSTLLQGGDLVSSRKESATEE